MDTKTVTVADDSARLTLSNVVNQSASTVEKDYKLKGTQPVIVGDGKTILDQYPKAGSSLAVGQHIYLITVSKDQLKVPNLVGKSYRDAIEYCSALGIQFKPVGSGFVTSQSLTPNTLYTGQIIELQLGDKEDQPVTKSTTEKATDSKKTQSVQ
ncbi:PASTA domain-containing protein [Tepidibacillus marianensis]|uniref:PASTA domain-containing protein n=1 Tax=Tepidibacillus marianensis TaxID=3131995 RepID=UPI0030CF0130